MLLNHIYPEVWQGIIIFSSLLICVCSNIYIRISLIFIYLPVLIIDSANQPMEDTSFEEMYPSLIEIAKSVGVQTIFISKCRPSSADGVDLIDITEGLNPFHIKDNADHL